MNEKDRQALADILRSGRLQLGWSARELGRRAGVDIANVTRLELGKVPYPRVDTVQALAAALGIPLADIYAATNWLPESALPSFRPYMRAKYGELTDEELAQVEQFISALSVRSTGPRPGEDE